LPFGGIVGILVLCGEIDSPYNISGGDAPKAGARGSPSSGANFSASEARADCLPPHPVGDAAQLTAGRESHVLDRHIKAASLGRVREMSDLRRHEQDVLEPGMTIEEVRELSVILLPGVSGERVADVDRCAPDATGGQGAEEPVDAVYRRVRHGHKDAPRLHARRKELGVEEAAVVGPRAEAVHHKVRAANDVDDRRPPPARGI